MSQPWRIVAGVAALMLLAAAGWWLWREPPAAPLPPSATAPPPTLAQGEVASAPTAPAPAAPASAPAVQHPIEPPAAAPPIAQTDIGTALTELLGRKAVLSWLQTDDFARRFVATVDNLGRAHAPAALWPVHPTPGRFASTERDGRLVIDADNAQRYVPLVALLESLDVERAVALYVRMYPLLQRAYEGIGYPGRYFNDRLFEVIDLLLATPNAGESVALRLTDVKGEIESTRPWVRYEFADPAFEKLPAGQKIMLRVGAVNERRLKARLVVLRQVLARATTAAPR